MISTEIPFSRSMFSSASIISEFMTSRSFHAPRASSSASRRHLRLRRLRLAGLRGRAPFEHCVARHDAAELDALARAVDLDLDAVVVGRGEHRAASVDGALRVARLERD